MDRGVWWGLQPIGLHRVVYYWSDLACMHAFSTLPTNQISCFKEITDWWLQLLSFIHVSLNLQQGHGFYKLSANAENSGNTDAELLWVMNCILAKIVYNCTAAWETSYPTFLLTLTPSQGQSCTVIWRLPPHCLTPSSLSLIGISPNYSLGYPILSWHLSLMEHQTNTAGIHAAERSWKTVHKIADCPCFRSWPLVSRNSLI